MTSQKEDSSITECKEDHPSCAKGKTVGLFRTGRILLMSPILSLGAFNKMYFDFLARRTVPKRNLSLFTTSRFSDDSIGASTNTACDSKILATSLRLFLNRVLPLETISQIASANPILGAISTEPLIICKSAEILFSSKN